jgi:hypothetical protein
VNYRLLADAALLVHAAFVAFVVLGGLLVPRWPRLAGEQGYAGGFFEHYVLAVLYPDGLTREAQLVLGLLVLAVNAAVYAFVWRRKRTGRTRGPGP